MRSQDSGAVFVTCLLALFQSFSFCLFYIGTSRVSITLNKIFQMALLNIILGSLLWFTVGFSMVFGQSQKGFIGAMDHALLLDLQRDLQSTHGNNTIYATPYSSGSMVIFEMTFAVLAPAMVLVTWSAYIKPTGAMLFMILWPLLVYYPLAHWIRGDGWLSGSTVKVIDQAGGLTLHTAVGTTHLLMTIVTKRIFSSCEKVSLVDQYLQNETENGNSSTFFLGTLLTWAGWISLNVGSVKNAGNLEQVTLLNTHFAACGSAVLWLLVCFVGVGRFSLLDILNGFMSGLAGSSSFCGYVEPWSALLIGCFIGFLSHGIFILIKHHVTISSRKNCVDITFVFGVPAILGSIAAGLFSRAPKFGDKTKDVNGAFFSNAIQLPYQLLGIMVVIAWTSFWTLLLFKFIYSTVGLYMSHIETAGIQQLNSSELHKRNNEERSVKERVMKAAKTGDLHQLQELRSKFAANLGLKDFYQRTALHYTSENGHYVCTEYLLKQREVDIHLRDRYGMTPLSEAVRKHRDDIVVLLLEHGASWSLDGVGDELCSYTGSGKIDEVRRLHNLGMDLNSTDCEGRTALHVAARSGDKLMVECLLGMNVHINKVDFFGHRPLNCAEMHEHEEISDILIRHGALRVIQNYSQREICDEASKGNLRMIKHMVNNGANVSYHDSNGRTALHESCKSGHLDVVKFLVNQPGVNVNASDKMDNTPLTEAILNFQNDVAEYLQLQGGETQDRRMMYLICRAVRKHDKRLLKQLLQWFNGSVIIDLDGQSVYHVCIRNGDVAMLKTLIKAGLSFREVDFFGNSPLELAIQLKCDSSIIKLLAELEEGKLKAQNSQINVSRSVAGRSKIRRRRTRRQTRVEVASGDFSEHSLPRITTNRTPEYDHTTTEYHDNQVMNDYIGTEEDVSLQERTVPEEVTLADIELMNRRKKSNKTSNRMSGLMSGQPQYV